MGESRLSNSSFSELLSDDCLISLRKSIFCTFISASSRIAFDSSATNEELAIRWRADRNFSTNSAASLLKDSNDFISSGCVCGAIDVFALGTGGSWVSGTFSTGGRALILSMTQPLGTFDGSSAKKTEPSGRVHLKMSAQDKPLNMTKIKNKTEQEIIFNILDPFSS